MTAPVDIAARAVSLEGKALILRSAHHSKEEEPQVVIEAGRLDADIEAITTNGVPLTFALQDTSGVSYPAIQYVEKTWKPPSDPQFQQKYFRLRRILMEFRSHSRGALARYRHKIEHERVLKNEIGQAVLSKLVADGILVLRGNFYYLDPANLGAKVGVAWQDLRRGKVPESLQMYIRSI